jgi:septum formation protein
MTPIILASNSPRRRDLLALTALPFIVLPVSVDETPVPGEDARSCVIRLASSKAAAAQKLADRMGFPAGQVIVAADTIVVYQDVVYGKPVDQEDARRMLALLRGHTHQVLTSITITTLQTGRQSNIFCDTDVSIRNFTDDEMDKYIKSGDPLDKAGAYAIQHNGFRPVEKLDGCYASVMGLPLCHLVRELENFQIFIFDDVPVACQEKFCYQCPVYSKILSNEKVI